MLSSKLIIENASKKVLSHTRRMFTTTLRADQKSYKLVIVGGGTGGCSVAAKFCRKLGKGNVAVIEPTEIHYYQPLFTLIGGGIKKLSDSQKHMSDVLPKNCDWIKSKAIEFDPDNRTVTTGDGERIKYEYLIIAMGMQLNFKDVKGLCNALETDSSVVSNYAPWRVERTFPAINATKSGNAIFTFPNTPIKCPGAPQKIMYLAEELFRKNGVRDNIDVIYNTSLPVIFIVKKYAASLLKVVEARNIKVNYRTNLIEVRAKDKEAVFENLDSQETSVLKYSFLHVTPPMSIPDELKNCKKLIDEGGFLNVNKDTLQHAAYSNIFGMGDCTSIPTPRTAAAIASQLKVVTKNLTAVMNGRVLPQTYDGYTSCPLVTSNGKCIMAEFDYNLNPLETFPINQGKERRTMFTIKKDVLPAIYWDMMLKGHWNGPGFLRRPMRLWLSDGRTKVS